jgi:RNA polymerase sigma-70 factor, ECF subfamily
MRLLAPRQRQETKSGPVNQPALSEEERRTFEQLAMPLLGSLYNFARWQAQNREDAEDLVQETYLKALRGFRGFQPETNFRAWMFKILRNTFLTSRTGLEQRMTVPLAAEEEEHGMPATSDNASRLIARCDIHLVHEAIDQLPLAFRDVILLGDVEEMSYREIAETLSIPLGTVMSRLSRARKAVCDAVEERLRGVGLPSETRTDSAGSLSGG